MRRTVREFLILFAPIAMGIIIAAAWFLSTRSADYFDKVSAQQQDELLQHKIRLDDSIMEYAGDSAFLARFIADRYQGLPDREFLDDLLSRFSISRKAYAQLRVLNYHGVEYVRFNTSPAGPIRVTQENLQDKSDRPYYQKAIVAPMGAVYISALDLNMEHGRVEEGNHPMIRFATPIRTAFGTVGLVVLNLDCTRMLALLREDSSPYGPWLINNDGHWLVGPSPSKEWGMIHTENDGPTFQQDYPEEWKRIMATRSGQFLTSRGLFTFSRLDTPVDMVVRPGRRVSSVPGHGLRLVSYVPPEQLKPEWYGIFQLLTAILLATLGLSVWRLSVLRITRRKAEDELRESEEQLKAISLSSHDAIAVMDNKGLVRFWNPAAVELFGYSEEQMLGNPLHELLAPNEDQALIDHGIHDFARTGRGKLVGNVNEIRTRRADGKEIMIELAISSVRIGDQWHAVGVMRDITKRRAAEEKLRESEAAARALLNAPPDAAMLLNGDGTLLALNNMAATQLGSNAESLIGTNLFDRMPAEIGRPRRSYLNEALQTGMPTEFRDSRDGRFYHGTFYPFVNTRGTHRAALFIRDITEDTKNRERVETLSKAVEQSSAAVFITDAQGVILYTNPRFSEMTGYTKAEAKGRHPDIIDSPDQNVHFFDDIWENVIQGEDWRGEIRHQKSDGTTIWALLSVSPIVDEHGEISHFVGVGDDITALKQSETALKISEERFRDVSEAVGEFIWEVDSTGRFSFVTDDVEATTGYAVEEILGNSPFSFMPEEEGRELRMWFRELRGTIAKFTDIEHRFVTKDGRTLWLLANAIPFTDEHGNIMGMRGASMDITERKRAEEALRASEEKLRALAEAAYEAIVMIDSNGTVSFWNDAAERLFGYKEQEALGKDLHTLIASPEDQEKAMNGMYGFAFTGEGKVVGSIGEVEAVRKDGSRFPAERSVASFRLGDKWYAVATVRDISERKLAEQQLKEMATTDPLTELFNRRRFLELAEQEFAKARRYGRPLTLLMLDLDHFKDINDTYGHDVGDIVLQSIAETSVEQLRDTDIMGRIGGEEFAVILPETDIHQAQEAAERIRSSIEKTPVTTPAGDLQLTISVGISAYGKETEEFKNMLKQADTALYAAKHAGRNTVKSFDNSK